ncbi:TetR/AcrR family transcriptional regulator [Actinocrinis sp.]|uniref:TetR/AcrR family transcriptional regulator n=1 Tax=Actinocrinis sp. TaxID=1920516 RepID=UPI002D78B480|nr:TetR/AcrR family transcriptional regulator [Actinocrinis sp.]
MYDVHFAGKATLSTNVNGVNMSVARRTQVIMAGMNAHAGGQAGPNAEPANEPGRARYHHGDLANALTRAGVALAREGGPDAVVLREAARQVGVSPAAAYRHFAGHDDLLYAVKLRAQQELADAMEARVKAATPEADPAFEALRRLTAVGFAYLHFALEEPGLFRTAFCHTEQPANEADDQVETENSEQGQPQGAGPDSTVPAVRDLRRYRAFEILSESLDLLVQLGLLRPERRANAELPAWAMVHGLATLLLDGPLDLGDKAAQNAMLQMCLDTIVNGLVN